MKNEKIFVQSCNCFFFGYNVLIFNLLRLHDFCTIPYDLFKNSFFGFLYAILHFVRKSCKNRTIRNTLIYNILC